MPWNPFKTTPTPLRLQPTPPWLLELQQHQLAHRLQQHHPAQLLSIPDATQGFLSFTGLLLGTTLLAQTHVHHRACQADDYLVFSPLDLRPLPWDRQPTHPYARLTSVHDPDHPEDVAAWSWRLQPAPLQSRLTWDTPTPAGLTLRTLRPYTTQQPNTQPHTLVIHDPYQTYPSDPRTVRIHQPSKATRR